MNTAYAQPVTDGGYAWSLANERDELFAKIDRLADELERTQHDLTEYRAEHRELLDERDTLKTTIAKQADTIEAAQSVTRELLLNVERAYLRGQPLTADWFVRQLSDIEAELLAVL